MCPIGPYVIIIIIRCVPDRPFESLLGPTEILQGHIRAWQSHLRPECLMGPPGNFIGHYESMVGPYDNLKWSSETVSDNYYVI